MMDAMPPGSLTVTIGDRLLTIDMVGGGSWTLPVGPLGLVEGELERADRPAPAQLTNALGIVSDHLDDVIRESPLVSATPGVTFVGRHAIGFARVELGSDSVPAGYTFSRADADEVSRTLVAERIDWPGNTAPTFPYPPHRRIEHNPPLPRV